MEAASLPSVRSPESPPSPEQIQKYAVMEALSMGKSPGEIARGITKDKKRQAYWRRKIRAWSYNDREFQELAGRGAKGEMFLNLGRVTQGLIRLASKGYPPAVKLVFEATGFHNPRMHQHEHSGELVVKLAMPRPVATVDEPIPDADVVED